MDFLVAGSNREKEGKGPGDITACVGTTWLVYNFRVVRDACITDSTKRTFQMRSINEAKQTQVQPARKLQHCMFGIFIRDYFHNNVIVCDKTIANFDSVLGN